MTQSQKPNTQGIYQAPETEAQLDPDQGTPVGCLGVVVGVLSFIPLIGVLFGVIAIIWGFIARSTGLKIAGALGIAFTVAVYSALFYFGFVERGGIYDDLRTKMAQSNMKELTKHIEKYKSENQHYPKSLVAMVSKTADQDIDITQGTTPIELLIIDPTVVDHEEAPVNLHYKVIDENHYHLRAHGADGKLGTQDDVYAEPVENSGLVTGKQPSPTGTSNKET